MSATPQPFPNLLPVAQGIHQSDFIIRTAVQAAIQDMRNNPWLIDWVFASMRDDALTKEDYREKQRRDFKTWFINTKIPVLMYPRVDQIEFPSITIALRESVEIDRESTTGDTHYQPEESLDQYWFPLAGPFAPTAFNLATGLITVPVSLQPQTMTTTAMIVVDNAGHQFPVTAKGTGATIQIAPNSAGDFSQITLMPPLDNAAMSLESASFRETYSVGCHVQGESVYLTILHAIVQFMLLRYREQFLEARGYERCSISSAEFIPDAQYLEGKENVFSRYISITGFVRQSWPKFLWQKTLAVSTTLEVSGAGVTPPSAGAAKDHIWIGDGDSLPF